MQPTEPPPCRRDARHTARVRRGLNETLRHAWSRCCGTRASISAQGWYARQALGGNSAHRHSLGSRLVGTDRRATDGHSGGQRTAREFEQIREEDGAVVVAELALRACGRQELLAAGQAHAELPHANRCTHCRARRFASVGVHVIRHDGGAPWCRRAGACARAGHRGITGTALVT